MAGLFGDNFNPNMGWLGQILQGAPQDYGQNSFGLGVPYMGPAPNPNPDTSKPSPLNPFSWQIPSLDNVLTGMLNGPNGAPQQQSAAPSMPPLEPPRNIGLAPGMNAPSTPAMLGGPSLDQRAYGQASQSAPQTAPQTLAPQAAQAMTQPQGGDFLQGLSNFSHNLGSSGGLGGVIDAFRGIQTGKRYDAAGQKEQNQQTTMMAVAQSLVARGYSPQEAIGMAQAAAIDPKVAEKVLGDAYASPKTMEELIARQTANQQRGAPGAPAQSPTAAYEEFLRAKSRGEKAGTTEGERIANAQIDLPSAVAQAKESLRLTEELKNHKGRDNGVFWHSKVGAYLPDSAVPGNTDARDAIGILNQIKGGAFLEAFRALKGGGAITEIEGKKATDAIARMDRSQSRAEFDKALSDYQGIIKLGIDRASQMAGQPAPGGFKGNSDWQNVGNGIRIRQVSP